MATFTKKILSGSSDGKPVKVVATTSVGTTIHTGSSTATVLQEVWIWAQNNHTADVVLTVEYGDTASEGNIIVSIKAKAGLALICPGLLLKGNAAPLTIRAFASVTNVISITGFVNEIS